jgi:hypothetical protein
MTSRRFTQKPSARPDRGSGTFARLFAFEDATDVGTGQTVRICKAAAIARQAAGRDEFAIFIDRGHRVPECQCGKLF